MIGYKLTTQDKKTRKGYPNETSWDIGVTRTAPGKGGLCSSGWIHFYQDPYLAVLKNPGDANIPNPRLWKVEAKGVVKEESLKCGCSELTILEEVEVPEITREQKVKFAELCAREAILCAKKVYKEEKWNRWADKWLSGEDRSASSASDAASYAADAASDAAASAYHAADAADAAYHASCVAAASASAYYASCAAAAAALADDTIDFIKLIKEALKT